MKKYSLGNHFLCSVAMHMYRRRDTVCEASPTQIQKLMLFRSGGAGRKTSISMRTAVERLRVRAHDGTECRNGVPLCKQSAICVSVEHASVASGTCVTGSSHLPRRHT